MSSNPEPRATDDCYADNRNDEQSLLSANRVDFLDAEGFTQLQGKKRRQESEQQEQSAADRTRNDERKNAEPRASDNSYAGSRNDEHSPAGPLSRTAASDGDDQHLHEYLLSANRVDFLDA